LAPLSLLDFFFPSDQVAGPCLRCPDFVLASVALFSCETFRASPSSTSRPSSSLRPIPESDHPLPPSSRLRSSDSSATFHWDIYGSFPKLLPQSIPLEDAKSEDATRLHVPSVWHPLLQVCPFRCPYRLARTLIPVDPPLLSTARGPFPLFFVLGT